MAENNDVKRSYSTDELGSAPVGRLVIRLAIPTVIAQLVNLLYNIVDRIYIGHMPEVGATALTGVGLCFPVIFLISAFSMLMAQGGAPLAAIEMGKQNHRKAEKIMGGCFGSLIITAVILTALFLVFGEKLLWIFGASENTIGYAMEYMKVYTAGSLFVMTALGMNFFITTQGYTGFSMLATVLGAVTNIALDPLFIFTFNMGVKGAAYATVISQALSACFVVFFLVGKRTKLKLRIKYFVPKLKMMLPIYALGLGPFVMQATEALLQIAFNSSLQKYGGDMAVAAMTIAGTVMQMMWLPAQGIGQGAQPIISYNYGAGNAQRVKQAVKYMFIIACAYMFVLWCAVELFPQVFINLFSDNEAVYETTTWALRIYIAAVGLMGLQASSQQFFMAIGKAKASLFIALLRKVIVLIPLIYILPHLFEDKVFAVFLAEPVADFISICVCTTLFAVVFKKEINKIQPRDNSRI